MHLKFICSLLGTVALFVNAQLSSSRAWTTWDINDDQWSEVVTRDVCIVGGGSSGAHAAVKLLDRNKTVAVVERNDRLGGHAETYRDPRSQVPVDFGVVIHQPLQVVMDFFWRFEIPLLNMSSVAWNQPGEPANKSLPSVGYMSFRRYSDFRNGLGVERPNIDPTNAFERMAQILSRYESILHGSDLPNPVPEDLYIPLGAFIDKHDLSNVVPTWYQFSQGMGDLLHMPTIYAIKYFNLGDIRALTQGYLTSARGAIAELYEKAGKYIGESNVFLQSTVVAANRRNQTTTTGERELLISTRGAGLKLLSCRQILLTIPPTLANLGGWDLSREEHGVFSQLASANGYWTGLVTNVGLNQTITYVNAAAGTPFHVPVLPALYALTPTGVLDDVWTVKFGSTNTPELTEAQVRDHIRDEVYRLQVASGIPVSEIEFLTFVSHSPFMLHVPGEEIRDGFFGRLAALQGGFGGTMFYSGAVFHTHYTALLWRFNEEVVIPLMMALSA